MVDLRVPAFRALGLGRNWGGNRPLGHPPQSLVHARGILAWNGRLGLPGLAPLRKGVVLLTFF